MTMPPFSELSLNILDIAQNSIRANASLIEISLEINTRLNSLVIVIRDNGEGFNPDDCQKSKKADKGGENRNGFGLALFKESAEITGGNFEIKSKIGFGTVVTAEYVLDSPYRKPIGDINATIEALILCCNDFDIVYTCKIDGEGFTVSTAEIKDVLSDIPLHTPEVMEYIRHCLKESTDSINKNKNFLKG